MPDWRLQGLALSCRPLGEQDRLLTLLSDTEGITRLAVPGARRPNSSLAAAVPLAQLQLQVGGRMQSAASASASPASGTPTASAIRPST